MFIFVTSIVFAIYNRYFHFIYWPEISGVTFGVIFFVVGEKAQ